MAVGCTSLGSFSARFTQLVGETPTAYRSRDTARSPACGLRRMDITAEHGRARWDKRAEPGG